MTQANRPLSPHLQVYRPQMTSVTSILHRMTGFALAVGAGVVTWWLWSVMAGPESYAVFYGFCKSVAGQVMLFGWLLALMYHFLNGVRHLIWDTGRGIDIATANRSGWMVLLGAAALTALVWCAGF